MAASYGVGLKSVGIIVITLWIISILVIYMRNQSINIFQLNMEENTESKQDGNVSNKTDIHDLNIDNDNDRNIEEDRYP